MGWEIFSGSGLGRVKIRILHLENPGFGDVPVLKIVVYLENWIPPISWENLKKAPCWNPKGHFVVVKASILRVLGP